MPISPSVEFQRLEQAHPRHREPSSLRSREVCPHCKRELTEFRFCVDGVPISTWSCAEHGDVQPMKSAISNPTRPGESTIADSIIQP